MHRCVLARGSPVTRREAAMGDLVPTERIAGAIVVMRGQKVMLDGDLARLYRVATGALNQAVRRNRERFPADFMFS